MKEDVVGMVNRKEGAELVWYRVRDAEHIPHTHAHIHTYAHTFTRTRTYTHMHIISAPSSAYLRRVFIIVGEWAV